jgi:hypothetical protein
MLLFNPAFDELPASPDFPFTANHKTEVTLSWLLISCRTYTSPPVSPSYLIFGKPLM